MTLSEVQEQRDAIIDIASRHGARNVRVFGSTARGTSGAQSDLDLLVELEAGRTLFDLGGLLMEMQGISGTRVDVATDEMLRPEFRAQALKEAIAL